MLCMISNTMQRPDSGKEKVFFFLNSHLQQFSLQKCVQWLESDTRIPQLSNHYTSQERQFTAVWQLQNDQPHQSPKRVRDKNQQAIGPHEDLLCSSPRLRWLWENVRQLSPRLRDFVWFKIEISSRTLIRQGSVHRGSTIWDDFDGVFPD